MLQHPNFDPVALQLGPLAVHWYGLMYLFGFAMVWVLGRYRIRRGHTDLTARNLEDLIFYCVLGVIIGGRLGYILFYKPGEYLAQPLKVLYLWEGGMAFHGGLVGVVVALLIFARKHRKSLLQVGDFIAPLIPLGLGAGRLGNFINGELWGRPTGLPWGMTFAGAGDGVARHPSQLYEMALEGVLLFVILWWFSQRPRATGQVSGLFLAGYGLFRFFVEFTREPDYFLGLLAGNLSMGQLLSLPMIIIGLFLLFRRAETPSHLWKH